MARPAPGGCDGPVLRRALPPILVGLLGLLVPLRPAGAQESGEVRLRVESAPWRVEILFGALLEEPPLRSALGSGLPLRIRGRVELWRDRLFDRQERQIEWRVTILHDPLEERFLLRRGGSDAPPESHPDLPSVSRAVEAAFSAGLSPPRSGTYYVLGVVEVETLSVSDLEELERWLRGDLGPAVQGEGNVGEAVTRGLRRLMIRMLDLPTRRIRLRSEPFRVR